MHSFTYNVLQKDYSLKNDKNRNSWGRLIKTIEQQVIGNLNMTADGFYRNALKKKLETDMVQNSSNRSMSTTVKVEVSICRAVSKNKRTLKYSSYFIDVIATLLLCRRIKSIIFVQHILRDGQYFLNMLLKTKTEKNMSICQSSQISFNG